ncbi:hypothetical protein E1B28_000286 [Marasmius oreades]|uniref:Uncharacterized protein n=1 Tax=Marasmius oreades TaxID=181124 RepID=A0A9P8AEF7_9AGAR|nr:uncharacterized protein E1B28_000286 [Marasmius oreades]KAG7098325.1 hypothetical protein E1B28_000286 [Marasmius oreades]
MFNLRTRSFQYDIVTSAFCKGYAEPDDFRNTSSPQSLPDCNPPLDSREIIRVFSLDFLQLISCGGYYAASFHSVHDVLTFGAVIDRRKPGILACFPSIQSPVWSCRPIGTLDIVPKYSNSVPSLVDLTFVKNKNNDKWEMAIQFSLRLPPEDYRGLRTAYLVQSLPFYNGVSSDFGIQFAYLSSPRH